MKGSAVGVSVSMVVGEVSYSNIQMNRQVMGIRRSQIILSALQGRWFGEISRGTGSRVTVGPTWSETSLHLVINYNILQTSHRIL